MNTTTSPLTGPAPRTYPVLLEEITRLASYLIPHAHTPEDLAWNAGIRTLGQEWTAQADALRPAAA